MTDDRDLLQLLRDVARADAPLQDYFRSAEESGASLAAALDVIDASLEQQDWLCLWLDDEEVGISDPVLALVDYCGSTENAQAVLDATSRHRGIDAARRWAEHQARVAAMDAIACGSGAAELIRSPALTEGHQRSLLERFAHHGALTDLALFVPTSESERNIVSRALRRRLDDALGTMHALADAGIDRRAILAMLARYWDAPTSNEDDPALAWLDVHVQLLAAASRPIRAALASIDEDLPVERWLKLLWRHGLGATAAALHLHERVPPTPAADIARQLHAAGYGDDEVLRALLENGLSSASTLRLLGDHGWSVDRLVKSMLARETLLPEVRDHLLGLGLTHPAIVDVLVRHVPADLVALVVPQGG